MPPATTPAPTLPRDDTYVLLETIRHAFPHVGYFDSVEERDALADALGLHAISNDWSAIVVGMGGGEYRNAWITESSRPFQTDAEFISVLNEGELEPWARAAKAAAEDQTPEHHHHLSGDKRQQVFKIVINSPLPPEETCRMLDHIINAGLLDASSTLEEDGFDEAVMDQAKAAMDLDIHVPEYMG